MHSHVFRKVPTGIAQTTRVLLRATLVTHATRISILSLLVLLLRKHFLREYLYFVH